MASPEAFADKMGRLANDLRKSQREFVTESALAATTVYRAAIRGAVPSGRLRNVGRSGATVGVGFDVRGQVNPVAKIRARGPLQLVEWATRPHRIIPRASRRSAGIGGLGSSRARRQSLYDYLFGGGGGIGGAALRLPEARGRSPFRGVVDHPGSRGKRPWGRAEPLAREAAAVTWTRAGRRKFAQHLRGG